MAHIPDPRQAIKEILSRLARRSEDLNTAYLGAWQCVSAAEEIAKDAALSAAADLLKTKAIRMHADGARYEARALIEAAEDIERLAGKAPQKGAAA